jgi:hypothetical protein
MQKVWALVSLWVGLALVATLLAIWFEISTALTEIVAGTDAQLFIGTPSSRSFIEQRQIAWTRSYWDDAACRGSKK